MATEGQSSQPPPDNGHSSDNNTAANPRSSSQQQEAQQQEAAPPQQSSTTDTNPITASQPESSSSTTTPASPPLPARPTATTPGPRAQRFQEMFDRTLTHTLAKISPENFAACYPTIASRAPHVLRQVQRGMVDRLAQLCNQELGNILERYAVVPRLNELEGLAADADLRRRAGTRKGKSREGETAAQTTKAPHLLPAEAVLAAHLAPHLASGQSQMNARLQNTQAANVALWEGIQAQRAEVEELLGALEAALRDVEGAAELMDGVPAEELARESRAVEAEMADA